MTEFPALRDALVRAAARRRRRRRAAGAAVPALAVAAAGLALVSLPRDAPDRERPAQTPTPTVTAPNDAVARAYAVFRRAQTTEDVLPEHALASLRVERARSRLVATDGDARLYAAAGTLRGNPVLCLLRATPEGVGAACGRLPGAATEAQPPALSWSGGYAFLLPDGTSDLRVMLADGTRRAPAPQDGAVLERIGSDFAGASWTGASGTRHISRNQFWPRGTDAPAECPALEPLPPDAEAQATRAALIAVDRLYPDIEAATVTAVRRPPGTPCGDDAARTLEVSLRLTPSDADARRSASLSQGRLLVGMVGGEPRVYYLLH